MTIFSFTSELEQYLREINPAYVKYTEGLWANEVTSTSQLGNASVTSILSCGIQNPIHAEDIIAQSKPTAVRTLDDLTLISEATARAIHRLKQEEESEQEEILSCTASTTPFIKAEAAARQLGFQVKTIDCELDPSAREQPLQPVYVWEHDEDSAQEKPKVLARLTKELGLSRKELQATAVFAKPLAQGWPHTAEPIFTSVETKNLSLSTGQPEGQALVQFLAVNILTDRPGWGVPVVLSDLTEATVFQRGNQLKDIFHVQFHNLREAYAHIRWLLDEAKANNPGLHLDKSAPPAAGMFTIMENEAHLESESISVDARCLTNDYDDDDDDDPSLLQKDHAFQKQLHSLAAEDEQIAAFVNAFCQDQQRMPSILDFVPSA